MKLKFDALGLVAVLLSLFTAAHAATPEQTRACAALKGNGAAFLRVQDAPTIITATAVSKNDAAGVEVCQVDGYVSPNVGIKVVLPLENWNGKYVQGGCGGACGTSRLFWCDQPVRRGYACAGTDMGHQGTTTDWAWAYQDPQAVQDFGFRSTHVTALAAKAIAASYYGAAPKRAYFLGCSTGGRQGFMEAQRFPHDFDGIVAGAPPLDETGTALQLAWSVKANVDADGQYILQEKDVRLLHSKVVERCDLRDGIKDGLIGDPRRCDFDPASLRCGAESGACLSDAQVAAARKLYAGPTDAAGRPIGRAGGVMKGSELAWIGDYLPGPKGPPQYDNFIRQFFQFMAFNPPAGPSWDFAQLDIERDAKRLGMYEVLFNTTNPDLRTFKERGGKLLSYQGWGDTSVVPGQVVDYYDTVTRTMGGLPATQDFFRLFMVPGMRHCSSDSIGADTIDYLAVIERWVEEGIAPDVLLGNARTPDAIAKRRPMFPLDAADVRFVRPHFPYPAEMRYSGKGDPADPARYIRVK